MVTGPSATPSPSPTSELDLLFAPVWAGGWAAMRFAWCFAALYGHLPRAFRISDAYAATDMVFTSGYYRLAEHLQFTVPTAWGIWAAGMLGVAMVAFGGRVLRPGIVLFMVSAWLLLAEEALNVKAHDRLMVYVTVGLLLSPAAERGLVAKWRSPAARWWLIVVFTAIYGSTGMLKLLYEPGWIDGEALRGHLLHTWHGSGPLAAWMSGHLWLCAVMGTFTVVFELLFGFLVWFRRTNPWILLMGAMFHVGIYMLMDVGAFTWVSLCAYPALLHPEVARALWGRWIAWRGGVDGVVEPMGARP